MHGDRVNIYNFKFIIQNKPVIYPIRQQIYDKYHWLEEDSGRRDTHLSFEKYTLQKYLQLNASQNNWANVKKIFRDATDYKLFSDVQNRSSYMFYSYMDFSHGICKPYV